MYSNVIIDRYHLILGKAAKNEFVRIKPMEMISYFDILNGDNCLISIYLREYN